MKHLFVIAVMILFSAAYQTIKYPRIDTGSAIEVASHSIHNAKVLSKVAAILKRKGRVGAGASGSGGSAGRGANNFGNTGPSLPNPGSRPIIGGSPVRPSYGGGRYFGGGAVRPYSAGSRSLLGIAPLFISAALLASYPGTWSYGVYQYPYSHPYSFYNRTAPQNLTDSTNTPARSWLPNFTARLLSRDAVNQGANQTKPLFCLCAAYSSCGCDDNNNKTFLDSIIGDGNYSNLNHTLVQVADVNGTSTIFLNGTLPNGTFVDETSDIVRAIISTNVRNLMSICILIILTSLLFA